MNFVKGDWVKINQSSQYREQAEGCEYGIVVAVTNFYVDNFSYHVEWKNKNDDCINENNYRYKDLLPYKKEKQLEFGF